MANRKPHSPSVHRGSIDSESRLTQVTRGNQAYGERFCSSFTYLTAWSPFLWRSFHSGRAVASPCWERGSGVTY